MNCHDIRNAIYVYLDGEFAPPEEAAFQQHVGGCVDCRELLNREGEFISAFKAQLSAPRAPDGLLAKIENDLEHAPAPDALKRASSPPSARRYIAPALAAAAAVALVVSAVAIAGDQARPVVEEAISAHQNDLPMEVRGSAEQVRSFLQSNVPFAVQVPFDGVTGVELVGARLTRYNGQQAVLFNFDAAGERVSVLQVAADASDSGDEPQVEARKGYGVVTFRHQGLTHSLVGNMAPAKLDRLQRSFRRQPLLKRASFQR